MKRSILTNGFKLTLRHWPALVWVYALNLVLARLFSLPLSGQLTALTGNSLYSQRLVSAFDFGVVAEIFRKGSEGPGTAASASYAATWLYVAIYFLIVPGTLFVYQTGAPAKLSTRIHTGFLYFWRFIRITLVSFVVFGIVLGILFAIQSRWSTHVDDKILGRPGFIAWFAGFVIIGLVAAFLRVYFDLVDGRAKMKRDDIAIVRIEQLYPFPRTQYEAVIARYPNAKEVVWCQEEPENQGAWYQIKHRLRTYLAEDHQLLYATRKGNSTTAVGYAKVHQKEQEEVVHEGLVGGHPLKGGA